MIETTEKRLPGIPDRALDNIVDKAGGVLTPYLDGKQMRQKLVLGSQTFDEKDNTVLLIAVLRAVANA